MEEKLNYLSYLDIYTGQHMPIGIINYNLYKLFAKGVTEQGHTILFIHTRPQAVHLHNLS